MKNIILVVLLIAIVPLQAQDTIVISKSMLPGKVAIGNLGIKASQKAYESVRADYHQSRAVFLPSITVSHTGITTTNPLMAFGSKLNQEVLTQADFNPALLNDPPHTESFSTLLEIQQPLINLDRLYEREAARAKMEAFALQSNRTAEHMQLEASKAYLQLQLAYKGVEVLKKTDVMAKSNLNLAHQYFEQGLLQKSDLLNVEIRANMTANQLQLAKSAVKDASDYLAFLLNEEGKSTYKPAEALESDFVREQFSSSLHLLRKDIQAIEKGTEAYEKMILSRKMAFLPRLNAFGNYQLYDDAIFGASAKGYLVGAQLTWNLYDGSNSSGKLERARAEYQKAQLEAEEYKKRSQLELDKAIRQLYDADNKASLSKLVRQQAEQAYHIRRNRFEQGMEKTTDLLMAESLLQQKELESLQAVFEYNLTKQYLQFLTK